MLSNLFLPLELGILAGEILEPYFVAFTFRRCVNPGIVTPPPRTSTAIIPMIPLGVIRGTIEMISEWRINVLEKLLRRLSCLVSFADFGRLAEGDESCLSFGSRLRRGDSLLRIDVRPLQ